MNIVSRDNTSMYDYAKEIFELQNYIEKKEKRKLTSDEFLILSVIVKEMNERS